MPTRRRSDHARLWVIGFILLNTILLLFGLLFFMSGAHSSSNFGRDLGSLFGTVLTLQAAASVLVSVLYLLEHRLAKTGMQVLLSLILVFWTLATLGLAFGSYRVEPFFVLLWLCIAAPLLLGIFLIHRRPLPNDSD